MCLERVLSSQGCWSWPCLEPWPCPAEGLVLLLFLPASSSALLQFLPPFSSAVLPLHCPHFLPGSLPVPWLPSLPALGGSVPFWPRSSPSSFLLLLPKLSGCGFSAVQTQLFPLGWHRRLLPRSSRPIVAPVHTPGLLQWLSLGAIPTHRASALPCLLKSVPKLAERGVWEGMGHYVFLKGFFQLAPGKFRQSELSVLS